MLILTAKIQKKRDTAKSSFQQVGAAGPNAVYVSWKIFIFGAGGRPRLLHPHLPAA